MIPFAKVQSIGNDFVLVEESHLRGVNLAEVARQVCQRRFSIGSDGLLVLAPGDRSRFAMRMFNPDGTEDFCGNGLRCAARYAADRGWVGETFTIEHGGRDVAAQVDGRAISTTLGSASFAPHDVPHTWPHELFFGPVLLGGEERVLAALTTGSTHVVLPVEELPEDAEFVSVSKALEHDPRFPQRTSVIWMRTDSDHVLSLRIWERGVGETLGCGTGSSAAAAAQARRLGRGGTYTVRNPGGTVEIALDTWDGPITVRGEASVVFEGDVALLR